MEHGPTVRKSTGLVNDHVVECYREAEVTETA
jgi:hypothetical protein